MIKTLRALVSKKKRRYRENGFDLDLSYIIRPRIIAMGFPSEGAEGMYRNPLGEVVRFLTKFHNEHYKIYNFCSEKDYDPAKFCGHVEHYPFDDHQAVPLNVIGDFCRSVHAWLDSDPKNVAVCHCKAGKGRTGLMVCSYLLYRGLFNDPDAALSFYGERRTRNGKGVTIASQRRYVKYFHEAMTQGPRPVNELKLTSIRLSSNCVHGEGSMGIFFVIYGNKGNGTYKLECIVSSREDGSIVLSSQKSSRELAMELKPVWLEGDVKVQLFHKTFFGTVSLFYFWFNTSFVCPEDSLQIYRDDLDKPMKGLDIQTHIKLVFEESRQSDTKVVSVGEVLSASQRDRSGCLTPSASMRVLSGIVGSAKVRQYPETQEESDMSSARFDADESVLGGGGCDDSRVVDRLERSSSVLHRIKSNRCMPQNNRANPDQPLCRTSTGSSGDFSLPLVLPPHPTPGGHSDSSITSGQQVAAYDPGVSARVEGSLNPPSISASERSSKEVASSLWVGPPCSKSLGMARRVSADVAELEATIDQLRHEKDRLERALLAERSVSMPLEVVVHPKGHIPAVERVEEAVATSHEDILDRSSKVVSCCSSGSELKCGEERKAADANRIQRGLVKMGELPMPMLSGAERVNATCTDEHVSLGSTLLTGGDRGGGGQTVAGGSQTFLLGALGHAITIEEFQQLQRHAMESRKENLRLRQWAEEEKELVKEQEQEMEALRVQINDIRAQWERERVKLGALVSDLEQKITEEKRQSRERDKVLMQRLSAAHSRTQSEIASLCMELDYARTYAKEAQSKLEDVSRIAEAEKESVRRLKNELREMQENMVETELLLQQENTVLRCELAELQGNLALAGLPSQANSRLGGSIKNNEKRMLQVEVAEALRDSIHRMKSLMMAMRHEQAINGLLNAKVKELLIQVQPHARKMVQNRRSRSSVLSMVELQPPPTPPQSQV